MNEKKPEWPREVCINQTLDAIAAELGDDYDEDDDNGLVATALLDSMDTIEIESWEEIPAGYELHDPKDREEFQVYLESKQHLEKGAPFPISQASSTSGTISAIDLKHGGYYDCIIDGEHGSDKFNFIQLAIDPKSKRRYILVDGSKKLLKDQDLVRELIKMTFQEIDSADFDGDPSFKFRHSVWPCILDDNGSLKVESYDWYLYGFIDADIIK
jgi:hypothetical protein